MYGMNYAGMNAACCPRPVAPVAAYGVGSDAGVGVAIIAVAILILIALGVIF